MTLLYSHPEYILIVLYLHLDREADFNLFLSSSSTDASFPFLFIFYPDLIFSSCSGGCTSQQLSVMLTQFKLFDKLDRSNLPISFWKQKGNSCFILTTIQLNERKSRSLSPLEWKILLINNILNGNFRYFEDLLS